MALLLSIGCLASSYFVLNSRKKTLLKIKTVDLTGSYPYSAKDTFKPDKDCKFTVVVLKLPSDQTIYRVSKGKLEWDEPLYVNANHVSFPLGNSTSSVDYKSMYIQAIIEGFDFSKVFNLSKPRIKESGTVKILKKYLPPEIYEELKYKVAHKWRMEMMKFLKDETIWALYHHASDKVIYFEKSYEEVIKWYKFRYYFWPYVGIGISVICLGLSSIDFLF